MSEEEIISRQDEMNKFVLQNADAVEEAIVEHDEAIEKIQQSFDVPPPVLHPVLYDQDGNHLDTPLQCEGCLKIHEESYINYCKKYTQDQKNDKWSYDTLKQQLIDEPIYCTKYNYTVVKELMNHF